MITEVERWEPVPTRWLGHRPEPLVAERLWGAVGEARGEAEDLREAGFDRLGRVVTVRGGTQDPSDPEAVDAVVTYGPGETVVEDFASGLLVRTALDGERRPTATTYEDIDGGDLSAEEYHYADGALVAIDESEDLGMAFEATRTWTGGRLAVRHGPSGAQRIVGEPTPSDPASVVWEPVAREAWPAVLDDAARKIAARAVALVADRCRERDVPPETEIFSLTINFSGQTGLEGFVVVGDEDQRHRWLTRTAEGRRPDGWRPLAPFGGVLDLSEVDTIVPVDVADPALRAAAMNDAGNPHRTVLHAAGRILARHDWAAVLRPTDDFVVGVAGHDDGEAELLRSIRLINPAERSTRFERSVTTGRRRPA